jgi:hypothetical protein
MYIIQIYSLPIPYVLGAFTIALPAITGLAIKALTVSVRHLRGQRSSEGPLTRYSNITILLLYIYDTVLAALAGTYIAPVANLNCGLEETWQELWHTKNGQAIRRIQEAFDCCGLRSLVDRAFPFPGKFVGVDGCKQASGREHSCLGAWREEERKVAGLMLMVVGLVGAWKVCTPALVLPYCLRHTNIATDARAPLIRSPYIQDQWT